MREKKNRKYNSRLLSALRFEMTVRFVRPYLVRSLQALFQQHFGPRVPGLSFSLSQCVCVAVCVLCDASGMRTRREEAKRAPTSVR